VKYNVTVRINPNLPRVFELVRFRPEDMDKMVRSVDLKFTRMMRRLYATEGASGGARWEPLSARYARQKVLDGFSGGILTRTGGLRRTLQNYGNPQHVARWQGTSMVFGTTHRLASIHDRGVPGRLPARTPIQLTMRQRTRLAEAIREQYGDIVDRVQKLLARWKTRLT
jgi:phage gpG-like protein